FPATCSAPPRPPALPYTTLFRSAADVCRAGVGDFGPLTESTPTRAVASRWSARAGSILGQPGDAALRDHRLEASTPASESCPARSEEHTSELQSPDHLVCRLLLE